MGIAVPWRPGDGRSLRSDRVPVDMRVLGRILPVTPWRIQEELPEAMPLRRLHDLLQHATACIGRHVPELHAALPMSNGHYPETLGVVFGTDRRELLAPGAYVLTDSSPSQRVLYVGSSVDGVMRSRLISHLYEQGRVHMSQQAYRDVVAAIQAGAYADEESAELALRHALFSEHRWNDPRKHKSRLTTRAAWLVSYGAFDIATVRVPRGYNAVARCLERYLVDAHLWAEGVLPPLNSARVVLSKELQATGRIDRRLLLPLVAELDDIALSLGHQSSQRTTGGRK